MPAAGHDQSGSEVKGYLKITGAVSNDVISHSLKSIACYTKFKIKQIPEFTIYLFRIFITVAFLKH